MNFTEIGFEIERTQDGSPTLRLLNGTPENGESMHHTGGAFTETLYIYGLALEKGFEKISIPSVLSVGLGLGYVETLAAAHALKKGCKNWELDSYEIVPGLREAYKNFYQDQLSHPVYEEILQLTSQALNLKASDLKAEVARALQENRLRLHGNMLEEKMIPAKYHIICYDAFSSKTNPDLWSEDYLVELFKSAHKEFCVLSTYACMGNLKRALKRSGFQMEIRTGFQGKRNCTWAVRAGNSQAT